MSKSGLKIHSMASAVNFQAGKSPKKSKGISTGLLGFQPTRVGSYQTQHDNTSHLNHYEDHMPPSPNPHEQLPNVDPIPPLLVAHSDLDFATIPADHVARCKTHCSYLLVTKHLTRDI